ncbi:MAG: NUDIX hydrolase [Gammaproteobacteria bacterium]|nr:NUDIX hydrolase [Gammaproteobacteria bacterium]
MHRIILKNKLSAHRPFDTTEEQMLDRIMQFVNAQPDCFERHLNVGHITGSAWIIDRERSHALLTHHRKLDRWLQLGGHSDGDPDTLAVSLREGREESGLESICPVSDAIFDVDVHLIPARKSEPDHFHYDVRFLLEADRKLPLVISSESNDLAWVPLDKVAALAPDASILRMLAKSLSLCTTKT